MKRIFHSLKKSSSMLIVLLSVSAYAQQIDMVNHAFYKPLVYNPAYAGAEDGLNVFFVNHTQWTSFKGAPRDNFLSIDQGFKDKKLGLGINVLSSKKGIHSKLGGNVLFSSGIRLNEDARITLGLSAGACNQSINFSSAVVEDPSDAIFISGTHAATTYDGSAGLAFIGKKLQAGFVVMQLFGNKIKYADNNTSTSYTFARHYMGSAKYKFPLSKEGKVSLAPQALVRITPNAPFQYDGNLNLEWTDKFWIGATYKSDYAVTAHAGICIHKQFSIGYSYEFITGSISKYSGMSHEIMVNLQFGKNKKPKEKPVAEEPKEEPVTAEEPEPEPKKEPEPELKKEPEPVKKEEPAPVVPVVKAYEKNWDSLEAAAIKKYEEPPKPAPEKEVTPAFVPEKKQPAPVSHDASGAGGVWMSTDKAVNFKDENNQIPGKGYYVVVRSFHSRELALAEVKRLTSSDYREASWIYLASTNFNYVYIRKVSTKKEAFKLAYEARAAGTADVWVQRIIE